MTKEKQHRLVAKTFAGLEDVLYKEICDLGGSDVSKIQKGVSFCGDNQVLYKTNLWSRTALRIFKQIDTFEVKTEDQLYQYLRRINWDEWMSKTSTYAVDVVLSPNTPKALQNAAEAAKDAIFNFFRDNYKSKPEENTSFPNMRINLHFFEDKCDLMVDSSGESLYKRGYRSKMPSAPINECLAAGLILLSEWDGKCNLIDPMCGSGTILIEAAMIAQNIAPRMTREEYLFKNWKGFEKRLWEDIQKEALSEIKIFDSYIYGSDISNNVLGLCKDNIIKSGLRDSIRIKQCPFEIYDPPKNGGMLLFNPPTLENLKQNDKADFYKMIGGTLKSRCKNMEAWVLCSDLLDIKSIGLNPTKKIPLYNGSNETFLVKFTL